MIRPYNQSIFSIRQHYLTTFPEDSFARPTEQEEKETDTSKIYKLRYTINLLPYVCSHLEIKPDKDGYLAEQWVHNKYDVLDILTRCNEWPVFRTKAVKDLIKFKWDAFGFNFHLIGYMNHMVFLTLLIIYDIKVYLNDDLYEYIDNPEMKHGKERVRIDPHGNDFALILLIGVVYSFVYLIIQIKKMGAMKLITQPHKVDASIWIEIVYICICILVTVIHQTQDPQDFLAKSAMLI